MIREALRKIVTGQHLTETESQGVMTQIMSGAATDAQIGSFITALRMKGETVEEITGFVKVMRDKVTKIACNHPIFVDTCGTGGDLLGTFNISTIAALVVAGAGIPVAKHGNRAVSSKCGSADLLLALGVTIDAEVQIVERCLNEIGIGFLFAPRLHQAMKYAIGPRREIGIRTVFNLLGPLTNPAGAKHQVMGIFSPEWTEPIVQVMKNLGVQSAYVVHGMDGMDEISTTGSTRIAELRNGKIRTFEMTPEELGLPRRTQEDLKGGDVQNNVTIARKVLEGEKGAHREIVILNAAAALAAAGKVNRIEDGLELAERSIDSGAARTCLDRLVKISHE